MRVVFFPKPKYKEFTYKPRYWDERKELLEQVKKRYAEPSSGSSEDALRQSFSRHWRRPVDRKTSKSTSKLTLIIYLAIIALLAWFIFS